MRRFYFLAFTLLLSQALFAQRTFHALQKNYAAPSSFHESRNILAVDTLVPGSMADTCGRDLVIYTNPSGGFVVGGNYFGDQEKMQKYYFQGQTSVTEVLVIFGAKMMANPQSQLYAKVYSVGADGGPADELAISQPVAISSIDTAFIDFTSFTFNNPVTVADSFFVGFVNPTTSGDTIGALSTKDSCYTGRSLAWEKQQNGRFAAIDDSLGWRLRIDLMIFPVVSDAVASANSPEVLRMLKLHQAYPNPAHSFATISYELSERSKISIEVFDLTGRKRLSKHLGVLQPGAYKNELDISSLGTGVYLYKVSTDRGALSGRLTVSR